MLYTVSVQYGIELSLVCLFMQHYSPWKRLVVLNSGTYLDADGAGRGCLSLIQRGQFGNLFPHGERVRTEGDEDDLLSDI